MSRRLLAEIPILAASAACYLFLHFVCWMLAPTLSEGTLAGPHVASGAEHVAQVLAWPGSRLKMSFEPPTGIFFAFAANMTLWTGLFSLLIRPIVKRRLVLN